MKKITFLISGDIHLISKNYRLFFENLEKEAQINIIDVSDLKIGNKNINKTYRPNIKYKYLRIKTSNEFKHMITHNKENLFCLLSPRLEDFLIFYYLKKNKTNLISFDIINTIIFTKTNINKKNKFNMKVKKLDKIVFLLLSYTKIIANFDYSFFCSQINLKKNNYFTVLRKKFLGEIKKINNLFTYKNKKNSFEKRYITIFDSFFHAETYFSKNQFEKNKESEYFTKLKKLLEMLSFKHQKQYLVSPHPKCPKEKYKKYFDKSKLNFEKDTFDLINESYLVIFSESSLINYIYANDIHFYYLKWEHQSNFEKQYIEAWEKKYPFNSIDLSTQKIIPLKITFNKNFEKKLEYPSTTLLNFLENLITSS